MSKLFLSSAACIALAACAAGPAPRSGFLGNYAGLHPLDRNKSLLAEPAPDDFDIRRYHAVAIDAPLVTGLDMAESDRAQLSSVFRQALLERVGDTLPVVAAPGPGVLHIRAAIVRASRTNVPVNIVTSLVGAPVSHGAVAAEAEVLDGGSGRRIAALSWARKGAKITKISLSYSRLGEAREGLRQFAAKLAEQFPAGARHQ